MWIQKKTPIAHSALIFSFIFHILIFIFIFNFEIEHKHNSDYKMEVILVSTPTTLTKPKNNMHSTKIEQSTIQTKSNETKNEERVMQDNVPDFFELEKSRSLSESVYDPLLDAKNRAKKAIADAKLIANTHKKSIKKLDEKPIDQMEEQYTSDILTPDNLNHLYKIEIINNSEKLEIFSNIIEQASNYIPTPEEQNQINQFKEQTNIGLNNEVLLEKLNSKILLKFTIDPQNLIILIEIKPMSIEVERALNQLIKQLNFDLIFISSDLSYTPYSFSFEFNTELY
ncbi:MAG: hypothetical protein I8H98_10430 [Moraxellaceae bacterium]|nr:hypothetical protein [Moraxellaceae bacterium]MBH2030742.1 hypothetical protein [Moraxellaceae bacterium]